MFNSKQKKLADQELEIYKKEKMLEIDKDVHKRVEQNWDQVDEARQNSNREIRKIAVELQEGYASRPAIVIELQMLREENKYLKETLRIAITKKT